MMKKMTLIKEFICGEEGKPAFIVDAPGLDVTYQYSGPY